MSSAEGAVRRRMSLPLMWLAGLIVVGLLGAAEIPGPEAGFTHQDTDYLVAFNHYVFSMVAAFAVFSFAYWLMDRLLSRGYARTLGVLHFAATLAGMVLMAVPTLWARAAGPLAWRSVATFQALTSVSWTGYLLSLAGLAIFAAVLVDAARRRLFRARPAP